MPQAKPELIELLLKKPIRFNRREGAVIIDNLNLDKPEGFAEHFKLFLDKTPNIHSTNKEEFFSYFFLGAVLTLPNTPLMAQLNIQDIFFSIVDNKIIKLVFAIKGTEGQKDKLIFRTIAKDIVKNVQEVTSELDYTNEELREIATKLSLSQNNIDSYEIDSYKFVVHSNNDDAQDKRFNLIAIKEEIDKGVLLNTQNAVGDSFHQVTNLDKTDKFSELLRKLDNTNVDTVKTNVEGLFTLFTEIYTQNKSKGLLSSEAAYHAFVYGIFALNFKYKYGLELHTEKIGGKGYIDIVFFSRIGANWNSIPIIVEFKTHTKDANGQPTLTGSNIGAIKALKQAEDNGYGHTLAVRSTAKQVILVGVDFSDYDSLDKKLQISTVSIEEPRGFISELLDKGVQFLNSDVSPTNNQKTNLQDLLQKEIKHIYYSISDSSIKSGNDSPKKQNKSDKYFSNFVMGQIITTMHYNSAIPLDARILDDPQSESRKTTTTFAFMKAGEKDSAIILNIIETAEKQDSQLRTRAAHDKSYVPTSYNIPGITKILQIDLKINPKAVFTQFANHPGEKAKNVFFQNIEIRDLESVAANNLPSQNWVSIVHRDVNALLDEIQPINTMNSDINQTPAKKYKPSEPRTPTKQGNTDISNFTKLDNLIEVLFPLKRYITSEAEFQAVIQGLFANKKTRDGKIIKVYPEVSAGNGRVDAIFRLLKEGVNEIQEFKPIFWEMKFADDLSDTFVMSNSVRKAYIQIESKYLNHLKSVTDQREVTLMAIGFNYQAATTDYLITALIDTGYVPHTSNPLSPSSSLANIKMCVVPKPKRSNNNCLISWEDIDKFNDSNESDKRNFNKIKISSDNFLKALQDTQNLSKQQQLIQVAEAVLESNSDEKIIGNYKNEVNSLITHHQKKAHIENINSVLAWTNHAMSLRDFLSSILNNDQEGLAINIGAFVSDPLGQLVAASVYKKGGTLSIKSEIFGTGVKAMSPFIASGASSAFNIYSLVKQVEQMQPGDQVNLARITVTSLDLGHNVLSVGVQTAKIFSTGITKVATKVVAKFLGPVGWAITVADIVIEAVHVKNQVDKINKMIGLTEQEKWDTGVRLFFSFKPSLDIQQKMQKKELNNKLVEQAIKFFRNQPDMQYYIFPEAEVLSNCQTKIEPETCWHISCLLISPMQSVNPNCQFTMQLAINNTIILDQKFPNLKWSATSPDDPNEELIDLLCRPAGTGGAGEAATTGNHYRCINAVGIRKVPNNPNGYALIVVLSGTDIVNGFQDRTNVFLTDKGIKKLTGGEKDDVFVLTGTEISGTIDGKEGNNVLDFQKFVPDSGKIVVLALGDIIGRYMNLGQPTSALIVDPSAPLLIIKKMHSVIGRAKKTDVIVAKCDTKLIDSQGGTTWIKHPGATLNLYDHIIIPSHTYGVSKHADCIFNMTLKIEGNSLLDNYAVQGNFTYIIDSVNSKTSFTQYIDIFLHKYIHNLFKLQAQPNSAQYFKVVPLANPNIPNPYPSSNLKHDFLFSQKSLHNIQKIIVQTNETTSSVSFVFDNNLNVTISSPTNDNNVNYYLQDNTRLIFSNDTIHAVQHINQSTTDIIKNYPRIVNNLGISIIAYSTTDEETISIGGAGNDAIENDPFHDSHLMGEMGENIYTIKSGRATLFSNSTIADIRIYGAKESNQTNTLDLSPLSQQVKHDLNQNLKLTTFHDGRHILISLWLEDSTNALGHHNLLIITLDNAVTRMLEESWCTKLQVILNKVPLALNCNINSNSINFNDPSQYYTPMPLPFNHSSRITISPQDVEPNRKVLIDKHESQSEFFYHEDDLIMTNIFNFNITKSNGYSIIFSQFFLEPKMYKLSIQFNNKQIFLENKRNDIDNAIPYYYQLNQYENHKYELINNRNITNNNSSLTEVNSLQSSTQLARPYNVNNQGHHQHKRDTTGLQEKMEDFITDSDENQYSISVATSKVTSNNQQNQEPIPTNSAAKPTSWLNINLIPIIKNIQNLIQSYKSYRVGNNDSNDSVTEAITNATSTDKLYMQTDIYQEAKNHSNFSQTTAIGKLSCRQSTIISTDTEHVIGLECTAGQSRVLIAPKSDLETCVLPMNYTPEYHDTYNFNRFLQGEAPSCVPVYWYDHPSVICEGKQNSIIYIPKHEDRLAESLIKLQLQYLLPYLLYHLNVAYYTQLCYREIKNHGIINGAKHLVKKCVHGVKKWYYHKDQNLDAQQAQLYLIKCQKLTEAINKLEELNTEQKETDWRYRSIKDTRDELQQLSNKIQQQEKWTKIQEELEELNNEVWSYGSHVKTLVLKLASMLQSSVNTKMIPEMIGELDDHIRSHREDIKYEIREKQLLQIKQISQEIKTLAGFVPKEQQVKLKGELKDITTNVVSQFKLTNKQLDNCPAENIPHKINALTEKIQQSQVSIIPNTIETFPVDQCEESVIDIVADSKLSFGWFYHESIG